MSYELDPELAAVMAALAGQSAATPAPARGDWKALRQAGEQGQAYLATLVPPSSSVQTATFHAAAGAAIPIPNGPPISSGPTTTTTRPGAPSSVTSSAPATSTPSRPRPDWKTTKVSHRPTSMWATLTSSATRTLPTRRT